MRFRPARCDHSCRVRTADPTLVCRPLELDVRSSIHQRWLWWSDWELHGGYHELWGATHPRSPRICVQYGCSSHVSVVVGNQYTLVHDLKTYTGQHSRQIKHPDPLQRQCSFTLGGVSSCRCPVDELSSCSNHQAGEHCSGRLGQAHGNCHFGLSSSELSQLPTLPVRYRISLSSAWGNRYGGFDYASECASRSAFPAKLDKVQRLRTSKNPGYGCGEGKRGFGASHLHGSHTASLPMIWGHHYRCNCRSDMCSNH